MNEETKQAARRRSTPERHVVVALRAGPMSLGSLALVLEGRSIDLDRILVDLCTAGLVEPPAFNALQSSAWRLTQAGHLIAHEEAIDRPALDDRDEPDPAGGMDPRDGPFHPGTIAYQRNRGGR